MSLKKNGVIVDCKQCTYSSSDDRGVFDISVPIVDSESNISAPARLRCTVSPKQHKVELLEWHDLDNNPAQSKESIQQRLKDTLTFVADRQVCGNLKICPSRVIQIVEDISVS